MTLLFLYLWAWAIATMAFWVNVSPENEDWKSVLGCLALGCAWPVTLPGLLLGLIIFRLSR